MLLDLVGTPSVVVGWRSVPVKYVGAFSSTRLRGEALGVETLLLCTDFGFWSLFGLYGFASFLLDFNSMKTSDSTLHVSRAHFTLHGLAAIHWMETDPRGYALA